MNNILLTMIIYHLSYLLIVSIFLRIIMGFYYLLTFEGMLDHEIIVLAIFFLIYLLKSGRESYWCVRVELRVIFVKGLVFYYLHRRDSFIIFLCIVICFLFKYL
jgi:hypothetical protein